MENLINYLRKMFDEPTLRIAYFMEMSKILVSEMKMEQVKEGENIVNKPSPNIIEMSYLRLCDDDPDFPHDMMGETFLHYLDYILRDIRANWRLDINRLKPDLASKCGYCNIALKNCPMKVLAYIKKCIADEGFNERAFFEALMGFPHKIPVNDAEENNIADKILYLCKTPIDLQGAEFLLDIEGVRISSEDYGKIYYKTIDFEIKKISLINNLYDYYSRDGGKNGCLDIANTELTQNFSYMFNTSPVELAVYIKYLCDQKNVAYFGVFDKIYKKLGKFENIPKLAYFNEYVKKIDTSIEGCEPLKQDLQDVLTYIRNYDNNTKLPYVKFDFLLYTRNSQMLDNVVSILNKYCRTYNYLSNKNIVFIDTELFIMRAKDSYDVILQLDRLYNENDFLVFANLDKALNINEYRLDTFFTIIPKFYSRNRRSVTVFSGEKKTVEKMIEKYDSIKKMFTHVINIDDMELEKVKETIHKKIKKVGNLNGTAKKQLDDYIEKTYKPGTVNESDYISEIYENIVYNKFKNLSDSNDIKPDDLSLTAENAKKLDDALARMNKLVGLPEVKQRVNEIMKYLEFQRKIGETQNINCNMIFRGNPGTGKTTMTKIMAEILYAMGITKSDKCVEVTGKDLIGTHLGETAPKTAKVVASAVGGVLVIDEAYTIMTSKGNADYPAEAVATLCESMDRYKDELIIIFAGTSKEMSALLSKYGNLSSRIGFDIEFEDFTTDELVQIFEGKLEERGYTIDDIALKRIRKTIDKTRINRTFGNARYIDSIFERLVLAHATSNPKNDKLKVLTLNDVENMEKMAFTKEQTIDDILKELNSLIGLKEIKGVLDGFISVLEFNKKLSRKTDFNMHMIFKGNAGTGKTTVARLIANIYYSLGYINKNKVVEVQSQDLIGEWLGQTGPKTQAVIDSALDGVLFIDEAYSLMEHRGSNASYTAEAIATLLKAMEDYKGRLIVIFAGYTEEMMQFRDLNPGLKSRIGFELTFSDYTLDELVQIFEKKIKDQELEVDKKAIEKARKILEEAKKVENFGNGRFVENMVQRVIIEHAKRMKDEEDEKVLRTITAEDVSDEIKAERSKNRIGF